jgi:hypothetical protein
MKSAAQKLLILVQAKPPGKTQAQAATPAPVETAGIVAKKEPVTGAV